jgi:hypothetical protein
VLLLALLGVGAASARAEDPAGERARPLTREAGALRDEVRQRPLAFEANHGQTDPEVRFVARGAGYTVFLTPTEAVVALGGRGPGRAVVRVKPVHTSPSTRLVPDGVLPGVVHYADVPATRPISAPTYERVRYAGLYPGVDLVYYGRPRELEYDFVVAPGADPGRIAVALEGAERLELDRGGDLVVHTAAGLLRQPRPIVYQEVDGARRSVSADYVLDGDGYVRFRLGAYDPTRRLVIDPVLAYSTYLGGSNEEGDWLWGAVFGIAVDTGGNAYVTGSTTSVDFPTTAGEDGTLGGSQDAFVTKLSPTGAVVYSTYLGDICDDVANDIAVDPAGNAYITGRAHGSVCFAGLRPGALVAKLDPTGAPLYSLVFGGMYADTSAGRAITVDAQGRAYVTGMATTTDFPTTPGAFRTVGCPDLGLPGYGDGFVAKVGPAGALEYSTFLCGNGVDDPSDIALDAAGNMVVAGTTRSGDFPTANPLQATSGSYPLGTTGFVSKLSADGTQLVFSTYLGGTINDLLNGLAVDAQGNVYVTGETESDDFPTTPGVLQPQRGNLFCLDELCTDAFVAKLNAAGSALVYSTYLYGENDDGGSKIAVDAAGYAYVVGTTASLYFPLRDAFQATSRVRGPWDAFVAKLYPDGTRLVYSSYLGGSGGPSPLEGADSGTAIAIDAAGNAYVAGSTKSYDFPTTAGAFQPAIGGGVCDYFGGPCGDAFVARITAGGPGPAAPTRVSVTQSQVVPGGTLTATWAGIPNPGPEDYLILYSLGAGGATYVSWWTTGGGAAGTLALTLPGNLAFGSYEIRLLTPDPNQGGLLESVARSQPIRVGATAGACGLGPELAAALPLLRVLRRRLRRRS